MGLLHFITGKGGVGKTSFALWLARQENARLYEIHEGLDSIKAQWPKSARSDLPAHKTLSRKALYSEFVSSTLHLPFLRTMLSKSSLFKNLLELAPNLFELLALQELIRAAGKDKSDKPLIIDAPSTGNFLSFLDCVQTALDVFDGGAMRAAAEKVQDAFHNQSFTVSIVSLPENSSLDELREIERRVHALVPHWNFKHVMNRLHPIVEKTDDLETELKELALKRPQRERERIAGQTFHWTFAEGDLLP